MKLMSSRSLYLVAQDSSTMLPNGISIFAMYECSSGVTLVPGIYSSGMVPRGRIPFPFLDHQCPIPLIYAGG